MVQVQVPRYKGGCDSFGCRREGRAVGVHCKFALKGFTDCKPMAPLPNGQQAGPVEVSALKPKV